MPIASMGELYGVPAQRANPLIAPAQHNAPAAAGRQMPPGTGPSVQALRSNNQASEAQQAMLMQVRPASEWSADSEECSRDMSRCSPHHATRAAPVMHSARQPVSCLTRLMCAFVQSLTGQHAPQVLAQQNARAPDLAKSGQLPGRGQTQLPRNLRPAAGQLGHVGLPIPNGRPRGLNPLQPLPAPLAGQPWGSGSQLLPRPMPPLQRPHERAYSPLLAVKPSLGYNTQVATGVTPMCWTRSMAQMVWR